MKSYDGHLFACRGLTGFLVSPPLTADDKSFQSTSPSPRSLSLALTLSWV